MFSRKELHGGHNRFQIILKLILIEVVNGINGQFLHLTDGNLDLFKII